jgi:peptidoglycan/LPS O-acetylase OafA/YrhL
VTERNFIVRVLLIVYALGSVAVVIPLLLEVPGSGDLAETTSGKILAGAILALGVGAALAARDPWQNRVMIKVLILFTALASVAIVLRILFHGEPYDVDPAWLVLPVSIGASILFTVFYPRTPET